MKNYVEQKIIDLESSMGLLQRDYEKQNEMLLQNTRLIQQMDLNLKRLFDQLQNLQTDPDAGRTIEDERPPHY